MSFDQTLSNATESFKASLACVECVITEHQISFCAFCFNNRSHKMGLLLLGDSLASGDMIVFTSYYAVFMSELAC